MSARWVAWILFLVGGVLIGGTSDAAKKPSAIPDGWVSEIALDELHRAAKNNACAALAERTREAALARLTCGPLDAFETLTDLVHVMRACDYVPVVDAIEADWELSKWLLENQSVSRPLFRALGDVDRPESSLKKLRTLWEADAKAVLENPNLAVAFATSDPVRRYGVNPKAASLLDSFRWYTNPKRSFRYDLKNMPYELSRFLADTRLSIEEREWAMVRYRQNANPARAYFDLTYDTDHFKRGEPKKISHLPYTLPNLREVGGVCVEQAYYASEICKALGMPAAMVHGRGKSGIGHAWVACLQMATNGREATWDCQTGRYETQRYFTGELQDPARRRRILDCQHVLAGAAAQLPLRRREEADAALMLARLVEVEREDRKQADLSVLEALAAAYNERFSGEGKKPNANTQWVRAVRPIDLALVEELLALSIARNLAHRPAWEFLIELCEAERFPTDHLGRFFDVLVTRTAKEYPDYSCLMVLRIAPTMSEASGRIKVYRKALDVYGRRPDLQGRILIALGDDFGDQGDKNKALRAYEQAAVTCMDATEVLMEALGKAEDLLLESDRRDLVIRLYSDSFVRARKTRRRIESAFRKQTTYYRVGRRLADLLLQAGKNQAANRILSEIDA